MKRDMELIRQILLRIEETENVQLLLDENYERREFIEYHLLLLREAGLIAGVVVVECDGGELVTQIVSKPRLTWSGHEFLDVARDETTWNQAKERVGNSIGTVAMSVLSALLIEISKRQLGL
ncbi:MAG: DUF2513 domain-containing protein [Planctomycetes bacterium]|nr:DUF2513 domain-containing protein [Planctomycetota bacterium]